MSPASVWWEPKVYFSADFPTLKRGSLCLFCYKIKELRESLLPASSGRGYVFQAIL